MILLRSQYQSDLQQMIEQVKERTYNSYVEQFVTYPGIDIFSMHFTYLFLMAQAFPAELRQTICLSQMLIQLGLDSHEEVGTEPIIEDEQMKSRQLRILSGDFFSAHYYQVLAERNQLDLIRKWADVIKEMNEAKADLHHSKLNLTLEEVEEKRLEIKGKLTTSVMRWFGASELWFEIYTSLAYLLYKKESQNEYIGGLKQRVKELEGKLARIDQQEIRSELTIWFNYIQEEQFVIEP